MTKPKEIGKIGNYYGGLNVMEHEGKFYWCIENYNTDFESLGDWDEIPESLYRELLAHDKSVIAQQVTKRVRL